MTTKSRNTFVYITTIGLMLTVSFMAYTLLNQRALAIAVCEPDLNSRLLSCNCPVISQQKDGTCAPVLPHCGDGSILQGDKCVKITVEFKNQGQCIKDSHQAGSKISKETCKGAFKDNK